MLKKDFCWSEAAYQMCPKSCGCTGPHAKQKIDAGADAVEKTFADGNTYRGQLTND